MLNKISDELSSNVSGKRKFNFLRRRKINIGEVHREFLDFNSRFPYASVIQRAKDFQQRSAADDTEMIVSELAGALLQGKGFSFVRMGDGEGRFVGIAKEYPHLYDQSKRIAKKIWYKHTRTPSGDFYDALEEAYANASIVGYVPLDRLALEAENVWYGYFGCACGNEFINARRISNASENCARLVRNCVNVDLIEHCGFGKLLRGTKVGIITCHANKNIFVDKFGLTDIEHVVIPPEAHALLSNYSNCRGLYPGRYLKILDAFAASDTQMYLIGAGVFAKIFCERLRRLGKVGIDFGSVLDKIAGVQTRSWMI